MAKEFGIKNGDITIKEKLELESLIDSFSSNRVYVPAIFVINKIDLTNKIDQQDDVVYISAHESIGIDKLKESIWRNLGLLRIYLVRQGEDPNFENPLIAKREESLRDVALKIGSEFSQGKKLAKIWGKGAKFSGQEVSLSTVVAEGMQVRFL